MAKLPSASTLPRRWLMGRWMRTGPSKRQFSRPTARLRQSALPISVAVDPLNLLCRQPGRQGRLQQAGLPSETAAGVQGRGAGVHAARQRGHWPLSQQHSDGQGRLWQSALPITMALRPPHLLYRHLDGQGRMQQPVLLISVAPRACPSAGQQQRQQLTTMTSVHLSTRWDSCWSAHAGGAPQQQSALPIGVAVRALKTPRGPGLRSVFHTAVCVGSAGRTSGTTTICLVAPFLQQRGPRQPGNCPKMTWQGGCLLLGCTPQVLHSCSCTLWGGAGAPAARSVGSAAGCLWGLLLQLLHQSDTAMRSHLQRHASRRGQDP